MTEDMLIFDLFQYRSFPKHILITPSIILMIA